MVGENAAMPPSVSVQICTLNEAANIGPCLETVWANDPQEVIIIDGGSTDDTVAIAEETGARVFSPGRLGLGPSRQVGYRATSCEFSAFVDADDRLSSDWLSVMVREMEAGGYSALQSSLRAVDTGSFWSRGWNQYFIESVRPCADTTMVGRPALFRTSALLSVDEELTSLDEDTHLSRRFELAGLRQGIGTAVAYRHVEDTWQENAAKWRSYGRGYRGFVAEHPSRRTALLRHMAFTIPVERAWRPVLRGRWEQPAFAALMTANIVAGWFQGTGVDQTPKAAQASE